MPSISNAAVFLDRDGVICEYRPDYVKSWSEFRFLPGALDALRKLATFTGRIVVISNQSCVGRGLVKLETVENINRRMLQEIKRSEGRIDGILVCPHAPEEGCGCRKPAQGMLREAAGKHGLDLSRCWLVGDNITDIRMGLSAGCRTILVRTGLGTSFADSLPSPKPKNLIVADCLNEAAEIILGTDGNKTGKGNLDG